jgi:hydrogenase nickel incorporation protein HypA/HybF
VHELSIASAIVEVATDRSDGAPVLEVAVEVGELSGVVADALLFAFDVAAAGTPCQGARLVVEPVPVVVHCPACGTDGPLAEPMRFRCAACGTPTGEVVRGRELHVVHLVLGTTSESPAEEVPRAAAR